MITDFKNKVAVITGAGSGIGAALCSGFSDLGVKIVAADIDADGAQHTVSSLNTEAIAVAVDVSSADSVSQLADRSFNCFGQVDLLINNAGVFQGGFAWERSVADWDWTLGVNLYGLIHAVQCFVPRMITQNTEAHIVNTASVAAFIAGPASGPYVVSKCAAMSFTECLAYDLAAVDSKIGVSVLTPSAIDTQIATTARVRSEIFGNDETVDGQGVAKRLAETTAAGISPKQVVGPVIDGIRSGEFLIPTKPSYVDQITNRYNALLERRLPTQIVPD
tara:strand:+ start:573 stop:1403 length:831 start_codon:yes stop_codon:yes gene_type:complete